MNDGATAPRSESWATRWLRRTLSITGVHVALWLLVGTIWLWLPLLALWDALSGGRLARVRFVCFTCTYLIFEVAGLYGALGLWCVRPWGGVPADRARHSMLQHLWVGAIFKALEAFYGLRVVIDAPFGRPTLGGSPIVFVRHASVADTLLPGRALSLPFGLSLRYVLKRELLVLPCLDVVGQRLPNMWVRRSAKDTAGDLQGVRALAQSLSPDEGVLIYPEGTRATEKRRVQALEALSASDPARHARLAGLRRLMPVKPGGALALLDAAPTAEVLVVGHVGFEGLRTFDDLWRGGLIGRVVRVVVWRFDAEALPKDAAGRLAWLDARWLELDAWVSEVEAR